MLREGLHRGSILLTRMITLAFVEMDLALKIQPRMGGDAILGCPLDMFDKGSEHVLRVSGGRSGSLRRLDSLLSRRLRRRADGKNCRQCQTAVAEHSRIIARTSIRQEQAGNPEKVVT
jgi:hypothetical protein